jgi:hypothetical protein
MQLSRTAGTAGFYAAAMALCVACGGVSSSDETDPERGGTAGNPADDPNDATPVPGLEGPEIPECADAPAGLRTRPETGTCGVGCGASILPPEPAESVLGQHECLEHADCVEGEGGWCEEQFQAGYRSANHCRYDDCSSDADCGAGFICICGDDVSSPSNTCARANCVVDADCGPGQVCAAVDANPETCSWSVELEYQCTSDADECRLDADCIAAGYDEGSTGCVWNSAEERRVCLVDGSCAL